jgi:ribosomal protein RSM22 (predicted rRNA methylase)
MSHKEDSKSLSEKYKTRNYQLSAEEVVVYTKVRLPATKEALKEVLKELRRRTEIDLSNLSFQDLGAGPATLLHAFADLEIDAKRVTLIEQDERLMKEGLKAFPTADKNYVKGNFLSLKEFPKADVTISSYSLNEIEERDLKPLVENVFSHSQFWVIVEPGTPEGYHHVIKAREEWIALGGDVIAPCPHRNACPLLGIDWCHFSVRVQRDREHMRLKGGSLPYEDEKFSYMILAKESYNRCNSRIIRHPLERKGLIEMALCTPEGLKNKIYTKSNTENFKIIKKKEWGEELV